MLACAISLEEGENEAGIVSFGLDILWVSAAWVDLYFAFLIMYNDR